MAETLADTNWDEHYIRRGDPSKPTYYIARRQYETTGLLGRYNIFAGHIRYALSKGWLPVIDMQNYPNPYLAPEKLGKENSWEYYFEQPLRIGLEQAYSGENIILSNGEDMWPRPCYNMSFYENKNNILTEWRMMIKLGLLRIKPAMLEEIKIVREKLFKANDRVLGVLLRGTDYVSKRPMAHPIAPPLEYAVSTVIVKMQEWKCNKVFLATEEENIVQTFKKIFGERLIVFEREYVAYKPGQAISLVRIDRPNDHFIQGKDYLTQIVLLSTCNSLVAARCSGSDIALMMSEHYENTHIFNLGRYGVIVVDDENFRV